MFVQRIVLMGNSFNNSFIDPPQKHVECIGIIWEIWKDQQGTQRSAFQKINECYSANLSNYNIL